MSFARMRYSWWFLVQVKRSMRTCSDILTGNITARYLPIFIIQKQLSHRIYASCDAFLMPSLFEPCGLSQLMALRYGTVPIVRETGGLKDTVEPYNEYESKGTGFSFSNYNAHEMLNTIRYAENIYYDKKREWNKIIDRAMATDYSWSVSALKYQEMYDWLIAQRIKITQSHFIRKWLFFGGKIWLLMELRLHPS